MASTRLRSIWILFLAFLPGVAYAQHIPAWFVAAVLSPLVVLSFSIILAVLAHSWRVGAVHAGLVVTWVLLFGFAAYYAENDYVIWTPMILYAAHTVLIVALIIVKIAQRIRNSGSVP